MRWYHLLSLSCAYLGLVLYLNPSLLWSCLYWLLCLFTLLATVHAFIHKQ